MSTVVGIDVSTRHIALASEGWAHKVLRPARRTTPLLEATELANRARDALASRPGGLDGLSVFIEAPVVAGARNLQTTIKLAMVTGALGCVIGGGTLVPVATWKKRVVGRGNADKPLVAWWLREHHPSQWAMCNGDQDLIDASCIAIFGKESHDAQEEPAVPGRTT